MKNIGVLLPKRKRSIINHFKRVQYYRVDFYEIVFVITYQDTNYEKIFWKHNIKDIVLLENAEYLGDKFKIIDGINVYYNELLSTIRKLIKSNDDSIKITIIDKELSNQGIKIIKQLTELSNNISVSTNKINKANKLTEDVLNGMGAVVEIIDEGKEITSGIVVVISPCNNKISSNCTQFNPLNKNAIYDFKMDFKVKPPLGMKNTVFKQCILLTN